jgi:three-Cys-motif partner protein
MVPGNTPKKPARKKAGAFYGARRNASAVKTNIVVGYFRPWANIVKFHARSDKMGYFDFFCGPGVYEDNSESTPVQIVRFVLTDERLRRYMMMLFEDKDPLYVDNLEATLRALDGFDQLAHEPKFSRGESARRSIEAFFSAKSVIPTFMFLDPFGYVGLTRDLIRAILKDWACEVLFYLNFNRIVGALAHPSPKIRAHMAALFGDRQMLEMQEALAAHPDEAERERIVLSGTKTALREIGAEYVLPFGFRTEAGRLDHHLVFATKNLDPAQKIMKSIMSAASSIVDEDGIGNFEFDPRISGEQPMLLDDTRALNVLKDALLVKFRGRTLRVIQVYKEYEETAETPFTIKNYQDALRELVYLDGAVTVSKGGFVLTESNIRRRHMHEDYEVTFQA